MHRQFKWLQRNLLLTPDEAFKFVMFFHQFAPSKTTLGRDYRVVERFLYLPVSINGNIKWLVRGKWKEQYVNRFNRGWTWIRKEWI